MRHRLACALLACAAALFAADGAAAAPGPFAAGSVWTAPLSEGAPRVANSDAMVAELRRQTALPGGMWIDTSEWSFPVYTVPAGQPTVNVVLDTLNPALQSDFQAVPLPPDARPARAGDAHLSLLQPSTDTLWEFWGLTMQADGWHARWGGKMANASTNPGYFTDGFGATATGLPLIGGLIRLDELRAGRIDHALAFDIPAPESRSFVWPANRTDGIAASGPGAIPEGTRFRIDPALDIDSLHLPRATAAMAKAAQRYGMIVIDRASSVTFKAEDPTQFGGDPYASLFGGLWPNDLMRLFPWDRLQVVAPTAAAFAGPVAPGAPSPPGAPIPPVHVVPPVHLAPPARATPVPVKPSARARPRAASTRTAPARCPRVVKRGRRAKARTAARARCTAAKRPAAKRRR